jgi:hypothetical protein
MRASCGLDFGRHGPPRVTIHPAAGPEQPAARTGPSVKGTVPMSLRASLIVALLLLQGADVVLTWRLLTTRPDVGEANPLALAVLQRHGWAGAVALKLACTAVAVGSALLVSGKRPALGRGLLVALCAVMATVVGYSGALLAGPPSADHALLKNSERVSAELDLQWQHMRALQGRRDAVCAELMAGRVTLPQAVGQMTEALEERRERIQGKGQASWPRPDRPGEVARFLVSFCAEVGRPADRESALRDLRGQVARHYPAPRGSGGPLPGWRALLAPTRAE